MTSEEVPNRVRDIFVATLTTTHIAAFPDPLPLGVRIGLVAPEGSSRERIRVRAEHDETGYFLDFYKEGNDGETSSHCRIREDGSITPLENLILVHPHFGDPEQARQERERRGAHNKRVKEILQAKNLFF
ncbi:hypothetical protein ACWZHB_33115 [Nocardia sp. FBN12]|uniref:hypothetical protein n=1 Tax=Nocardia sp. FBN12 TaxID=3419766 RepID=UPI003D003C9C